MAAANNNLSRSVKHMYSLSFYEAVEKCMKGEGFIRGDRFRDGVYVKKQGETLIAVDAFHSDKIVGNFYISAGIMAQKYKVFHTPAKEELMNGRGMLAHLLQK